MSTTFAYDLYENTVAKLKMYGEVSEEHSEELHSLCAQIASFIDGGEIGKVACEMQPGMGKTTCLISLLQTIFARGVTTPLLISVPDTSALASLLRELDSMGIRCGKVFSRATVSDAYGYSPTPQHLWKKEQFLIVCKQRLDSARTDIDNLLEYADGRQRFVIHDETPALGKADTPLLKELKSEWELIKEFMSPATAAEVEDVLASICRARDMGEAEGVGIVSWKKVRIDEQVVEELDYAIKRRKKEGGRTSFQIQEVVRHAQKGLRITNSGVVSYTRSFPKIERLLVLDASFKYSPLSRLNEEIKPMGLGNAKHYRNLKFILKQKPGGLDALIENPGGVNAVVAEAERKHGAIVLLCKKELKGIVGKHFLNKESEWLNWGMHTSTNQYSRIPTIVCAGLLRLKHKDLLGKAVVSSDSLMVEDTHRLQAREALVELYQGVSRGMSRGTVVSDGRAQCHPSRVVIYDYLSPKDDIPFLKTMFPECQVEIEDGEIDYLSKAMEIFGEAERMSTVMLKRRLGCEGMHTETWNNRILSKLTPHFKQDGRSLVKLTHSI
jgi:hypothetical protein